MALSQHAYLKSLQKHQATAGLQIHEEYTLRYADCFTCIERCTANGVAICRPKVKYFVLAAMVDNQLTTLALAHTTSQLWMAKS